MDFGENMESNVDLHIKDEAERLFKEIELVKKNVENSKFYAGMRLDLKQNKTIQEHFSRLLGSHSQFEVVIDGLGSIEYGYHSQFELAVALLLKQDFPDWIGNIQIYEPRCKSPADIIVFKRLGLTIDENCQRIAQKPTILYMPNPYCYFIGRLLGENWSLSCLSKICLLTNSFRKTFSKMQHITQVLETTLLLEKILAFTTEIDIKTSDNQKYDKLFSGFAWHFFDVDPNSDIGKPECYWLYMQRHLEEEFLENMKKDQLTGKQFAEILADQRGPRRLRFNKVPHPPGWIKLNIYGIGTIGDQRGRYSGIFQDEKGERFDRYGGDIDVEDNVIAGLEALKLGLTRCVDGRTNAEKLIVESDNVILVQYVNGRPEPNETTMQRLTEIFDLQKHITCAVYHIYEEANEAARDLDLRGECPNSDSYLDFGENMESNVGYHIQDEATRLLKEIKLVKKNVENSKFYAEMRLDLEGNERIEKLLSRLLVPHEHFLVVIYGLGSIEYNFKSQFQLAVILLLKRDFSNWIGDIEIYDPVMSPVDIIVFKELGLKVLTIDEHCRRRVQRPTMFYMPYLYGFLIGYLLGANWSSSCLNQIILLTISFTYALTDIRGFSGKPLEAVLRCKRILEFTTEIDIKTGDNQMYDDLFSGFAWHFFDVDPTIDIDKPGWYWLDTQRHLEEKFVDDMQRDMTGDELEEISGNYRGPRRLRYKASPPPPGWIKLNIYGIGTKDHQPGRYSGIFQDEKGMCLDSYRGDINVEDNVIAGLEALRLGLTNCREGKPIAQKLIVESDNAILVHYVNGLAEPNETTMCWLKEIFDLLEAYAACVVHNYIYEEANEAARDLAERGYCPNSE